MRRAAHLSARAPLTGGPCREAAYAGHVRGLAVSGGVPHVSRQTHYYPFTLPVCLHLRPDA
jgi:hypothetical protein